MSVVVLQKWGFLWINGEKKIHFVHLHITYILFPFFISIHFIFYFKKFFLTNVTMVTY